MAGARPLAHVQPHAAIGHLDERQRVLLGRGSRLPAALRLLRDALLQLGGGCAVRRQAARALIGPDRLLGQRQVIAADIALKEAQRLQIALQLLHRLATAAVGERLFRVGLAADDLAARAVQALAQRAGRRLRARVIEGKDVLIALAVRAGHLLRAALAHAHAVPESPEAQRKGRAALLDRHDLVAGGIDRQAQHVLHPAEGGQVHGRLGGFFAVGRGQREAQLRIDPAGGGVLGRVRRHLGNPGNFAPGGLQAGRVELRISRVQQRLGKRRVQAAVFRNQRALDPASGVFQVVRVVLNHQIRRRAAPDVGGALGLAAVAGGVEALGVRARAGGQAHAARAVHRADDVFLAGGVAIKDLAVRVVRHVVAARGLLGAQGVGARGDRLSLERLNRIAVGHLIAHHAVKVGLDVHPRHRLNPAVDREDQVGVKGVRLRGRGEFHAAGQAARQAVERDLRAAGHLLPVDRQRQARAVLLDLDRRAAGDRLARAGVAAAGSERNA